MGESAPQSGIVAGRLPPGRTLTRGMAVVAVVRVVGVVLATLAVYALLPIHDTNAEAIALLGGLGLLLVAAVFVRSLRRIPRSPRPILAAAEALALVLALFLSLFALVYVAMAVDEPTSFSEPLSKVAAFYFSVTVLATVGFGDITATTDATRAVVTIQMILDLLLIGAAVRLVAMSAREGIAAQYRTSTDTDLALDVAEVVSGDTTPDNSTVPSSDAGRITTPEEN